jgi:hypothetical protein
MKKEHVAFRTGPPVLLAAFFLCLFLVGPVNAEVGTCNSHYEVVVTGINGRSVHNVIKIGDFLGQGRARIPVRARSRARRNAERCMQAHWYNRTGDYVPYECSEASNISGYNIRNLRKKIKKAICSSLEPFPCNGQADIRYSVYSVVEGGAGCGSRRERISKEVLDSGIVAKCKCPKPLRLAAPKQISPAPGTVFYHAPRRTLLAWQPVHKAEGYVVEIKHRGRLWAAERTSRDATFFVFDFPGQGQGEWRVWAVGRRGVNGLESGWRPFSYARAARSRNHRRGRR